MPLDYSSETEVLFACPSTSRVLAPAWPPNPDDWREHLRGARSAFFSRLEARENRRCLLGIFRHGSYASWGAPAEIEWVAHKVWVTAVKLAPGAYSLRGFFAIPVIAGPAHLSALSVLPEAEAPLSELWGRSSYHGLCFTSVEYTITHPMLIMPLMAMFYRNFTVRLDRFCRLHSNSPSAEVYAVEQGDFTAACASSFEQLAAPSWLLRPRRPDPPLFQFTGNTTTGTGGV